MPACSSPSPSKPATTRNVPLPVSTTGATRSTVPVKRRPGSASTVSSTVWPARSLVISRSGTLSVASSRAVSTMRKIGELICTKLPGLMSREAITPEIGATTFAYDSSRLASRFTARAFSRS